MKTSLLVAMTSFALSVPSALATENDAGQPQRYASALLSSALSTPPAGDGTGMVRISATPMRTQHMPMMHGMHGMQAGEAMGGQGDGMGGQQGETMGAMMRQRMAEISRRQEMMEQRMDMMQKLMEQILKNQEQSMGGRPR